MTFVEGRTTFLITHAVTPSVLELIDKVAVMDHGRLVAYGTHQQVLATCPIYERLFHARSRRTIAASEAAADAIDVPVAADALTVSAMPPEIAAPPSRPEILPLPFARGMRLAGQNPSSTPDLGAPDDRRLRDAS